ncbi:hypothetical protein EQG63_04080 [Flavobacterium amnicola]|uniref:TANFOR domain-containing protein n=1 Tax=Flavobacterium amnicola TaxID=2506422 RepID=A0A4Q1K5Q4_9FLAO|nr:hypothetical protein [Flavobacterium amnicola]RXR21128.1 hypothetical protein EQG63_04080 [Flavobacterium amnicola]
MRNIFKLLNFVLLLLTQFVWAQRSSNVNVTVQVLPPYSTYLPDYVNSSNKVMLTLLSYENANVKLKATITGDNGITVATSDNYRPATPLKLTAYQSKMLTGLDLRNYLEFNSVTVTGISKNELFRGSGIPEGNYTLCVQVLDYNSGQVLSSPEPLGCSNLIRIEQITPPQLITPRCDEPIMAGTIQNVIFSWLPSAGAPAGSQYKLKIVELIPATRNPNEAMNSATTPAFFETTTTAFSFVYGPAQPQLKKGKKYAWRVTLLPAGVRSGTPLNTQNKGNSEVCSFEYKEVQPVVVTTTPVANTIKLLTPTQGEKINNSYGLEFSWTASTQPVKKYQIQFTDRISQEVKITNWNTLSESWFAEPGGWFASKIVGLDTKLTLPPYFTAGNGKVAWRIVGLDAQDKIIDKSAISVYEIVDAPLTDRIKLITPINGKQISGGENMTYEWTASKKKTVKEYFIQWKYIKNKNEVSEKLFSDTDFNGAIGPFTDTKFSLKTQVDQSKNMMAWRIVAVDKGKTIDSSLPDYVEFVEDTSELVNLKALAINGYVIQITKVSDKNQDSFAGQGKILLWEGGPEAIVWFKDLKIRPITYYPKTKTYTWAVVSGSIDMPASKAFAFSTDKVKLYTDKNSEGEFHLQFKSISFKADLKGSEDTTTKLFKIDQDLGKSTAQVTTKWYSNFFIWQTGSSSSNQQYVFESSNEGTVSISYKDRLDGQIIMKNQKMTNLENKGIEVNFDTVNGIKMLVKGLMARTELTGTVSFPKAKPFQAAMTVLNIPFKQQPNLNFPHSFEAPLQWKLNGDGSVWANVQSTYVHLSDEGQLDKKFETYNNGLNFDKFGVEVKFPIKPEETKQSSLNLNFDNIYHDGKGYSNNKKGEAVVKSNVNIAGFVSKLKKCEFLIKSNKLITLNLAGELYVPFLNDWAGLNMYIDDEKIQESNVSFDYDKKYYLTKSQSGSFAYVKISLGRLEGNAIVVQPSLTIKNSENKGLETENMSMCDMYINANGTVSYDSNFNLNSESTCEGSKKWATYYRFTYGIDKMKIKRNSVKTDAQFLFTGDVVLGEKIGTTDKKEMGFVYHGSDPKPNTIDYSQEYNATPANINNGGGVKPPNGIFKGPSTDKEHYVSALENSLEISDDGKAINGGYEDGAQKFGGGFKIKTNDPTWGNYFELGGYYEAKEPDAKELQAKMVLGKTLASNGKYTYWFFEFKQKGLVAIPIVPGILEAHGFGGKAYYHIQPTYNNLGQITDMVPNKAYSLGIAAEADVRTAYDQGATLHGHVQVVTQFKGWSIDGIDYFVKGDAIAPNSNSAGLVQARLNGKLNWMDKYLDGTGQIWGGIKDIVCINEGAANEDAISFHFGADDFYLNVGSQEAPITAEVMCGSGFSTGVWLNFDTKRVALGFNNHYDSGWKGLDLGVASASGRLTSDLGASLSVAYAPFQATGSAWFNGRAYGQGCVDFWVYEGCISGSCGVSANLNVSMPNPVVFDGSVVCDVHRWIPNFTLHARWASNGGFSISL